MANSSLSTFCRVVLVLAGLVLASGCGFHLRGHGGNVSFAQKIFLEGPGASTNFAAVFGNLTRDVGGEIVKSAADSAGIVHLHRAEFWRQPITLSRIGLATGFDLSYRIVFDIRTPKGEIIKPRTEFEVKRDYFNDQSLPLAQQAEEGQIRAAIESEAAQSLLQRVVNQLSLKKEGEIQQ